MQGITTSYMARYLPILVQVVLALGLSVILLGLSWLLGFRRKSAIKTSPYECGIPPVGDAGHRFAVKFYLVAIIFILFDIEAIFVIPWAVVEHRLKLFGFWEMVVYMAVVLTGF